MNGIFIVDKPIDWTSHDVVAKLRGVTHIKRIGHSGTLDPMATGVLAVFVGRATRAVEFAEGDEKQYIAGLRLGTVTDTQDITGTILEQNPVHITEKQLEKVLAEFRGDIMQIPPMYSAIKVNGKKLYDLARKGQTVERKPRPITISELKIIGKADEDWIISVTCSKGTYIRTLCNDIGQKLGVGGCMSHLRRVRAGVFTSEMSHSLAEIENNPERYLMPVDSLFAHYPKQIVDSKQERFIRCGNSFSFSTDDGTYRFYNRNGDFLMLGEVVDCRANTIKSFFEVD